MAVALTVSATLSGANYADSLTGGSTGIDAGEAQAGEDNPATDVIYLRHNGTFAITNLAVNVQSYTGTYGGDYSASADVAKALQHGDANAGFQIDFRWDASVPFSTFTQVKSGVGSSYNTRITVPVESMSLNNAGTEVDAISPTPGKIGASGDSVAGDRAHMIVRYKLPLGESAVGKRQFDILYSYNFQS